VSQLRSLTRRLISPVVNWLDQKTRAPRSREAGVRFHVSGHRATDGLLSRFFFAVSAASWGTLTTDENHLASFSRGLERCAKADFILDLGTGAGASAALLAENFPESQVVAVDVSRRMVAEARRLHSRPNLTIEVASATHLPYPDAVFDLVTIHNAAPDMHELRRVLKPSGQSMQASSFSPLAERTKSVRGRWEDFGMILVAEEDVGHGAYQLFTLDPDADAPPMF
jgi:SAM-dependent methyltransferase